MISQKVEWSPFKAYGEKSTRLKWPDIVISALLLSLAAWMWYRARGLPAYGWNWTLMGDFLIRRGSDGAIRPGLLLLGLCTTLRVGFWTILVSFALGGSLGLLSARKSLGQVWPITIFINLARNTPPLVILFCVYFFAGNMLPVAPLETALSKLPHWAQSIFAVCVAPPGQLDSMMAAVLALGCYQAAYVAEITRAGIEAVNRGQWDAAAALGFGRIATLWMVILPQALRLMLPPLAGQAISTFKDSALASLISLPDLTFQSLEIMAVSSMTFEIWITTAILYLGLGMICAILASWLESRLRH